MKSEIIAVGSEMLTPWRQDTNSLYLTEKFNEIGVTVAFKTIVGDRRKDLVGAIRTALGRTDVIAIMGGLGPTEDDLTREAVAEALSLSLSRNADQLAALHARAAMIPESQADKLLAPIYTTYPDVETTILAHAGDIQLTLLCAKTTASSAQSRVDELAGRMEEALEDWLYSSDGESLEQIVLYYLGLRQSTLAVAESCTGGMIAERITSVPGSSRSFLGGAVVYADALKNTFAGVSPDLISLYGAVSEEVASALATGIRLRTGATLGVGVTGIAGPSGATADKPIGLVHIAVSDANKTESVERTFKGDRTRIREFATQQALDLVRRRLM